MTRNPPVPKDKLNALTEAVRIAVAAGRMAAEDGDGGGDGGRCNSDCAFIYCTRPNATMEAAIRAGGASVSWRARSTYWSGGYAIRTFVTGQGARQSRMAQAMVDALKSNGFDAVVRYETD